MLSMPPSGMGQRSPSLSTSVNRTIVRLATDGRGYAAKRLTLAETRNVTREQKASNPK